MHSTELRGIEDGPWIVHHNGDYSGDVEIQINTYHPAIKYKERVDFINNKYQRESMQELIHDPLTDQYPDFYQVKIPFKVLEQIVANKVRMDAIEKIDEMTSEEILKAFTSMSI